MAKISKSSSLVATEIEEIAVDIEAVIETAEDIEETGTEETEVTEVIEEIEEETKGRETATTVANLATSPETAPSVLFHCNLARKER